ncbi:hypothetical protein BV25DRAFT_383500 [Artomyces pyxidatus]|uniref:Uncharacterized protein n=1 Tax=Artomyces pyxidatus TaxID=48021 RepID=A0ACB8T5Y1_9AGAM|nr:hypothetical protein BV25DRAFT_383500 [Artomyces pyxidatus]
MTSTRTRSTENMPFLRRGSRTLGSGSWGAFGCPAHLACELRVCLMDSLRTSVCSARFWDTEEGFVSYHVLSFRENWNAMFFLQFSLLRLIVTEVRVSRKSTWLSAKHDGWERQILRAVEGR